MKMVVFGLSVSSSWGNGHATLWRGLIAALARRGVRVVFFERDVSWYRDTRDLWSLPGGELVLYEDVTEARPVMERALRDADVAMVTSFCPDGVAAADLISRSPALKLFYDLDTPVTLERLAGGEALSWIGRDGLAPFDLVLGDTGGAALDALRNRLGARRVAPLYGHVDPSAHRPAKPDPAYSADLSYLGTTAADRRCSLDHLFVAPARRAPHRRFIIGGAQYPADFPWAPNIAFVRHLPPEQHPAFYASSALTLTVTRAAVAASGWCPSARLFEAAACGTAVLTDRWAGIEAFFEPGEQILIAANADDTLAALDLSPAVLRRIGEAARDRVLAHHTSAHRADDLLGLIDSIGAAPPPTADGATRTGGFLRPAHEEA